MASAWIHWKMASTTAPPDSVLVNNKFGYVFKIRPLQGVKRFPCCLSSQCEASCEIPKRTVYWWLMAMPLWWNFFTCFLNHWISTLTTTLLFLASRWIYPHLGQCAPKIRLNEREFPFSLLPAVTTGWPLFQGLHSHKVRQRRFS